MTELIQDQSKLFSKMARVMAGVERIAKTGKFRSNKANFDYATATDVYDHLRELMAAENLVCIPAIVGQSSEVLQTGVMHYVDFHFTFCDGETGATFGTAWRTAVMQYGSDDKIINKAATIGTKYFLLTTFLVSTGEHDEDSTTPPTGSGKSSVIVDAPRKSNNTKRDEPEDDDQPQDTAAAFKASYGTQRIGRNPEAVAANEAQLAEQGFKPGKSPLAQQTGPELDEYINQDGTPATPAGEIFTDAIDKVHVKTDKRGKLFYGVGPVSIFKTDVWVELGYDEFSLEQLSIDGAAVELTDPVRVAYIPGTDGGFNEAQRIHRPMNKATVDLSKKSRGKKSA